MKKFSSIILFALLIVGQSVIAQDLYIAPNPVYVDDVTSEDFDRAANSFIYNDTESSINLTWVRTIIEISPGWTSAVCDNVTCYGSSVDTKNFVVAANAAGNIDVHVYPGGVEGAAIVKVEVHQTDAPSNSTSAMYYFNQAVGVTEKFTEAIKIYPNPTQDYISIDNTENLAVKADVYSVTGKLVLSSTLSGSERINVQQLPAGNYILKLLDANSRVVSTNLLVKQ